jgi:hypothetical protein
MICGYANWNLRKYIDFRSYRKPDARASRRAALLSGAISTQTPSGGSCGGWAGRSINARSQVKSGSRSPNIASLMIFLSIASGPRSAARGGVSGTPSSRAADTLLGQDKPLALCSSSRSVREVGKTQVSARDRCCRVCWELPAHVSRSTVREGLAKLWRKTCARFSA